MAINEILESGGDTSDTVKKGYEKAKDTVNDALGSGDVTQKFKKGYEKVKKVFDDLLDQSGVTPNAKQAYEKVKDALEDTLKGQNGGQNKASSKFSGTPEVEVKL